MKIVKATSVFLCVLAVVGLLLAALIGYGIGSDKEALGCKKGDVVTLKVAGVDDRGNGDYTVSLGDCEQLKDDTFVAVVEALVGRARPTTTTTTTAPTAPKAA